MTKTSVDNRMYDALIAKVTGNPLAMVNLARTLFLAKGLEARGRALCEEAVSLAPDDPEVAAHAYAIRSIGIGGWYFTMVQDHNRHEIYAKAFRRVLKPGCTVLDIGAGTGLLSMIAIREGAGKVIACERNAAVAQAAREIVARNGLSDKITILTKDAKDLEIGVDLDEPADVLLWDNLANNLLGAGGLATVEDAKRRLLVPNAPIIPQRAEIRVALLQDTCAQDRSMTEVDGFDMTPFNHLRTTNFTCRKKDYARLSDAKTLFDIDFKSNVPVTPERAKVVMTTEAGQIDGIGQSVRFHLTDHEVYDTSEEGVMAFGVQFHTIKPIMATAGQSVIVAGNHDRELTWFWVE